MNYPQLEFLDDPMVTLAHVSPPKKLEVLEAEEEAAAEEVEGEEVPEGQEAEEQQPEE